MTTNTAKIETDLGIKWLFNEQFGFSEIPLNASYEAYFKAMLICANGDGTLADAERDWVIGYASAYNRDSEVIEKLKAYKADEDLETVFKGDPVISETRRSLILDAIQTCAADGEYSEKERAIVLKAAKILNISKDELKKIEEIYLETVKLREKRIAALFPNGLPY
ncbi:TerB family tellurite resistance protein [Nostoc sp. FACHB-133]|uniref:TerB family tellurite resistance protein n=1 Tax=Nostoc sp. FACHB-133 TaxID=2692835 RepID=UPI00168A137F|nr:TerB family tellurite resistance protein [Nostoc sp. FACHB-133]MBD2524480.1 TerB family tellurite resistance protein [Nostoc sp. FACHB-133]